MSKVASAGGAAGGESRLDRSVFLRPIAHRGLHHRAKGRIENTAPAFRAAIERGYGIECDLQAAKDGTPMVFHDAKLDRLIVASGPLAAHTPASLARLHFRGQYAGHDASILTFAQFLKLVGGRVPLLVEVKRNKEKPARKFLARIAKEAARYKAPIALMSFDAEIVATLGRMAPDVPRGWIVGNRELPARWWAVPRTAGKDAAVARLLDGAPAGISFLSVEVRLLPSVRTWLTARAPQLALFCWTVRTQRQRTLAARWADAPTFEGYEP